MLQLGRSSMERMRGGRRRRTPSGSRRFNGAAPRWSGCGNRVAKHGEETDQGFNGAAPRWSGCGTSAHVLRFFGFHASTGPLLDGADADDRAGRGLDRRPRFNGAAPRWSGCAPFSVEQLTQAFMLQRGRSSMERMRTSPASTSMASGSFNGAAPRWSGCGGRGDGPAQRPVCASTGPLLDGADARMFATVQKRGDSLQRGRSSMERMRRSTAASAYCGSRFNGAAPRWSGCVAGAAARRRVDERFNGAAPRWSGCGRCRRSGRCWRRGFNGAAPRWSGCAGVP